MTPIYTWPTPVYFVWRLWHSLKFWLRHRRPRQRVRLWALTRQGEELVSITTGNPFRHAWWMCRLRWQLWDRQGWRWVPRTEEVRSWQN